MRRKELIALAIGLGILIATTCNYKMVSNQPTVIEAKEVSTDKTEDIEVTEESEIVKIKNNPTDKRKEAKEKLKEIEEYKSSDRKKYIKKYKNIMDKYSDVLDRGESIYDVTTDSEFELLAGIVEAEIGIGDFDAKCNVASAIVNRYRSERFPDSFRGVVSQRYNGMYQFETYAKKRYNKVTVTNDTKLAIEYAYEIEDTVNGATYFHSGVSYWHQNSLKLVAKDQWHKFYTIK